MGLDKATPKNRYLITSNNAPQEIRKRLSDLGVHIGAKLTLVRVAPLGDPIEIKINRVRIALRKEEAQYIQVEYIKQCKKRKSKLSYFGAG